MLSMTPIRTTVLATATLVLLTLPVQAQKTTPIHPGRDGSPHVKSEWTIDTASIAIEYGRPYLKGRPQAALMPPGEPWRAGADEATTLTSSKSLTFGTHTLAPGTYTINVQP